MFIGAAQAQDHSIYCKGVDNTAASQECLAKHLKTEQERLSAVYEKLNKGLSEEKKADLKALQTTWLTYRDAECMWEASRPSDVVLKRVNELSCMARVTQDRADLLTTAYGELNKPDVQRQVGALPRWMNVLSNDHPQLYWNYGSRLVDDLNCDGQEDHIMMGVQIVDDKAVSFLAIVNNPPVGKPSLQLVTLSSISDKEETPYCIETFKAQDDVPNEVEKSKEEKLCKKSVLLSGKNCRSTIIKWTGNDYQLEVEQVSKIKKD